MITEARLSFIKNRRLYFPLKVLFLLLLLAPTQVVSAARQAKNAIDLFNGKSLEGWEHYLVEPDKTMEEVWSVRDGLLICKGEPMGYLATKESYTNFRLVVEWRWAPGKPAGNSGVLMRITGKPRALPKCAEAQLQSGNAGDIYGFQGFQVKGDAARARSAESPLFGKLSGVSKIKGNEKEPGQWNRYDITLKGGNITVAVNGEKVNEATGLDLVAGKIGLQSEGGEIHFRTVRLIPLPSQEDGASAQNFRRLPVSEYRDRMAAGWIGQMVGVGWGAPTEFRFKGEIIPEDKIPAWTPGMVNQFNQDDIYVEMTFLRTMELYGLDCSIRQAGIDFANSGYRLWHANKAGRDNLRNGIAPPDSGHPKFNAHADDIDYQIEADFSGLIAPGMPNVVIELGEKFGRLMNYGDGVYGGQFVGGMYAEAFFEDDPLKIVQAGLACVPAESVFAECMRDTVQGWKRYPDDWQKTWQLIEDKYQKNTDYRKFSCSGPEGQFNIDAKINAAYIIMGLLYGDRQMDETIVISMRCGQDSDCNPSNAGGVLGTTMGQSTMAAKFVSALNPKGIFSHTAYSFPALLEVCEKLARKAVIKQGGRIEGTGQEEVFVIPRQTPRPSKLEQCWTPGPVARSVFTEQEQMQVASLDAAKRQQADLEKVAPGWRLSNCGPDMDPGLRAEYRGKRPVFMTHPLDQNVGCTLTKKIEVPSRGKTTLRMQVANDKRGDFLLIAKVDGKTLVERTIGPDTIEDGWATIGVDLSPFAGKRIKVELTNQANGWNWEAAYWAKIDVVKN